MITLPFSTASDELALLARLPFFIHVDFAESTGFSCRGEVFELEEGISKV